MRRSLRWYLEFVVDAGAVGFVAGEGTAIPFPKDGFFVLFPQDAHAPGMRVPGATKVKKVVLKVLL